MPTDGSSNIRVFVHWRDQTVFAGEEVRCTVIFKNVAQDPNKPPPQQKGHANRAQHQQQLSQSLASPLHGRTKANASGPTPPPSATSGRGHRRAALSLSVPPSSSRSRPGSIQWPQPLTAGSDGRSAHSHARSVSIVSIGSTSTFDDHHQQNESAAKTQRPQRGHNRANSLQIMPRGGQNPPPAGPLSGMGNTRAVLLLDE